MGRTGGKRPSGRLMRRWEDNIRLDVQEMKWRDMDWFDLVRTGTSGGHLLMR